ncbi:MAG: bifunctional (p)ppGpp synthetase/guanosine-3',5'-bis(diphosphate) 3'-pyrophosphohydrolase [Deltaproteobacteria bacterium]|jgi:GTP pyrophosphokinase|nr:bifunctional (p)ppGpp synthetase/guanosine-3',5'-bis(diphosphate) 3'-pyrophosphohydrolase [Deltaproteobacteria bacterium]
MSTAAKTTDFTLSPSETLEKPPDRADLVFSTTASNRDDLQFPPGYPKRDNDPAEAKENSPDYKPIEGIPVYGMRAVRIHEIIDALLENNPNADDELVSRAYVFAATAHQGMLRRSGEPYLIHPLAVAWILTDMRLDAVAVAAGLLHDVVEDTKYTLDDIRREFGPEVTRIVDGVTKISKLNFSSATERAATNMRKMILAMLTDLRVIMVKLADRLNNMRTLGFMPQEKQVIIAKETLDIFAPLAARLGIQKIQTELEDLSFFYLEPQAYIKLRQDIYAGHQDRQKYVEEVKAFLFSRMAEFGIACEIEGRPKHLFSIWRKMNEQNLPFEQIFDLVAFRIIVNEVQDCYSALGVIHSIFRPIPGRFKDYISLPKQNGYRSLHTAVVGLNNYRMEIQIRTKEMHAYAEEGIAAHWRYKEGGHSSQEESQRINSLRSILAWQDMADPSSFLNSIRESLAEQNSIFVYTPQGDVKELPLGATPLDFAYAIHSDIGNHCGGAKINGIMANIRQKLNSGDTVEILTNPKAIPSRDWLRHVASSKARARIKQWFAAAEKTQAEIFGQDLLVQEMRRRRLKKTRLSKEVLQKLGFETLDELNAAVAYGRVSVRRVMETILPELQLEPQSPPQPPKASFPDSQKAIDGILVKGVDDIFVRYGKCCAPVPGEPIVGFLTHGNGVTIHTTNCKSLIGLDPERFIEVSWDLAGAKELSYEIYLKVQIRPSKGGLAKIMTTLAEHVADIIEANTNDAKSGSLLFKVAVENFNQYLDSIKALTDLGNLVARVERFYPDEYGETEEPVD